jgi:CubicO group peptidase (beta-lactamase class C family)
MNRQDERDLDFSTREVVPGQLGYRQLGSYPLHRDRGRFVPQNSEVDLRELPAHPLHWDQGRFVATSRPRLTKIGLLVLLLLLAAVVSKFLTMTPVHQSAYDASIHPGQQPPSAQEGRIASNVNHLLTSEVAQQQFSGSVLLAQHGHVLLSKGYSMADWEKQVPNTPQTKFYLGSTTKQFTAMAILLLQQQGKLHVSDALCSYIPHCPPPWQPVTIHQVLTHTSGIAQLASSSFSYTSVQAWIASFDHAPLAFTPGQEYSYCSICYQILGYVIEQTSGEPYSTFLQQAIFDPLQMKDTGFDTRYPILPNHAVGYASWQVKDISITWDVDPQWSFLLGSGLLYSTVEDLYRWDQALYGHTLFSQQTLKEAFTPYVASQYAGSSYGYGWFIAKAPTPGHQLIWHDGKVNGFRTYIGRYINDQVTIILLSNLSTVDEMALAQTLEQIVF